MRQVSRAEAERLGGPTKAAEMPAEDLVSWTNPRTGRTVEIDRGLDPSWAGNPGLDRARLLQEAANAKLGRLGKISPAAAREGVRQMLESPLLERRMEPEADGEAPKGAVPVGWLDAAARRAVQTGTGVLVLDRDGADGLRAARPRIGPEDVRRVLPALLAEGALSVEGDAVRIDWTDPDGGEAAWRALIRRRDGEPVLAELIRL